MRSKLVGCCTAAFSATYCLGYLLIVANDFSFCVVKDELTWMLAAGYTVMTLINIALIFLLLKNDSKLVLPWLASTLVMLLFRIFGNECTAGNVNFSKINNTMNILIFISLIIMLLAYEDLAKLKQNNHERRQVPDTPTPRSVFMSLSCQTTTGKSKVLGLATAAFGVVYCLGYLLIIARNYKFCLVDDKLRWVLTAGYTAMTFLNIAVICRLLDNDSKLILPWLGFTLVMILFRTFGRACTAYNTTYSAINNFINFLIFISLIAMLLAYDELVKIKPIDSRQRSRILSNASHRPVIEIPNEGDDSVRETPRTTTQETTLPLVNDDVDLVIIRDSDNPDDIFIYRLQTPEPTSRPPTAPENSTPESSAPPYSTADDPPDYETAIRNSWREDDNT